VAVKGPRMGQDAFSGAGGGRSAVPGLEGLLGAPGCLAETHEATFSTPKGGSLGPRGRVKQPVAGPSPVRAKKLSESLTFDLLGV
jgi:hypothetical protein